jgi:hypothetical protein
MTSRTAPATAVGVTGGDVTEGKADGSTLSGSGVTITGTKVGSPPVGAAGNVPADVADLRWALLP